MNRSAERKQFLEDIIVAAVEGGINYWAVISKYTGISARVAEDDTDDTDSLKWQELDVEVVARGIGKLLRERVHIAPRFYQQINIANAKNDAGMLDAELADCIVQAGLLGEIRYS